MQDQMLKPIVVLRQRLDGQRLVDEDVMSSVAILSDKLERLKAMSPMFEAVGFSPDIEAMRASSLAMAAN